MLGSVRDPVSKNKVENNRGRQLTYSSVLSMCTCRPAHSYTKIKMKKNAQPFSHGDKKIAVSLGLQNLVSKIIKF